MSNILVYVNQPIPISETFVYNQTVRLRRYRAYFLGAKTPRSPAINLPKEHIFLINRGSTSGWLSEAAFKVLGYVPKEVLSWIKRVDPLLIHAHGGPYGALALPLAERLGLPLIVSFHGTDATMKDLWVWRRSHMAHRLYLLRRRRLAERVSQVVVPSHFLWEIVVKRHGFPQEKVVVVPHGVDTERFKDVPSRPEWGHILYVGRLIRRKGLPYLLKAVKQVADRFPEVHLTVIGDGPMRKPYERLAREMLGTRVRFLGAQPHDVVLEHMRRAYVFCMPSVTMPSGEAETFGVVFLEAMAMKVPPVSFRSGGIPEVIRHGETGFLAEERDVDGLAHYLVLLLENTELRNQMGEMGHQWVEREFNLRLQNEKLEALYDKIIDIKTKLSF